VPSYNVQLLTEVSHGLVVSVDATTDAIDYQDLPSLNGSLAHCRRFVRNRVS
jgi:hypothetical protein